MLRIAVKDILSAGIELSGTISQADLNIRPEEIKSLVPLAVSAKVKRTATAIQALAQTRGKFEYTCGRCLQACEKDFEEVFDFHYPIDPEVSYIDVGEDVREEVILGFPDKVLCQEECKGLCVTCGVDLNKEKCKCKSRK